MKNVMDRALRTHRWLKHGEVRLNDDKSVDEIVINNCDVHLEQMSDGHWWMGIYTGKRKRGKIKNRPEAMHVNLFSKKPIRVTVETDDGRIAEGFPYSVCYQ